MQRTEILEYTAMLNLGPPARDSNAQWLNFPCPYAPWKHASGRDRTPSFGIWVSDDEDSFFQCFACKEHGPLVRLPLDLGHLRGGAFGPYLQISQQIQVSEFGKKTIIRPWIEEVENIHETAAQDQFVWPDPAKEFEYYSAAGHWYLRERGISWATAISLGLRFDPFQRRILFPVKDFTGRFAGFSGRAIDRPFRTTDEGPLDRAGNPFLKVRDYFGLRKREFLLGEHRCRATGTGTSHIRGAARTNVHRTIVVLVEGLFDYAYLTELGVRNALALMGSALTPVKADKLLRYDGVILFMDNDQAGIDARNDIAAQLFKKVPIIDVKYPDGFDGADPASLPPDIVKDMLSKRRQILSLSA